MRSTRLAALLCAASYLTAAPAFAGDPISFIGPVTLPNGQASVANRLVGPTDPLPTYCPAGFSCAGATPFAPDANGTESISVTTSSAPAALPGSGTTAILSNTGAAAANCVFGSGTAVATSSNSLILPGQSRAYSTGGAADVACIGVGATTIVVETGTGSPVFGLATDFSLPTSVNLIDAGGATKATVKAANTAAGSSDTAVVVAQSPTPNTVCTGVIAINQVSSTDLKTSTAKLHICSVVLVTAAAQNVSLVEGTNLNCAAGTAALIGGSLPSVSLTANGGFSVASERPWLKTQTTGDHLCLLQSGTGNVSGVITYTDAA